MLIIYLRRIKIIYCGVLREPASFFFFLHRRHEITSVFRVQGLSKEDIRIRT